MASLELETFTAPAGIAIRLAGRIDGKTASDLDARLGELVQDADMAVVLDFVGVTFVSSAGLRTLLSFVKRVQPGKGSIVICRLQPEVDEVFEISGFKSLFECAGSLEAALAAAGLPADLCGAAAAGDAPQAGRAPPWRRVTRFLSGRTGA